jgi:hypothetical protein
MSQQLTIDAAMTINIESDFARLHELEKALHQGGNDFDQKIHLVLQSLESIQKLKRYLESQKTVVVECLNTDQSLTPFE